MEPIAILEGNSVGTWYCIPFSSGTVENWKIQLDIYMTFSSISQAERRNNYPDRKKSRRAFHTETHSYKSGAVGRTAKIPKQRKSFVLSMRRTREKASEKCRDQTIKNISYCSGLWFPHEVFT